METSRTRLALRGAAWVGVAVVGLGGLGVAEAGDARRTANRAHGPAQPDRPGGERDRRPGPGLHGVVHGEFTVRTPEGGFEQRWMQRGTVTDVTPASITIQSPDDYSKTYVVTPSTEVRKGRADATILDVKVGDQVGAFGNVVAGVYTAQGILLRAERADRPPRARDGAQRPPRDGAQRPDRPAAPGRGAGLLRGFDLGD